MVGKSSRSATKKKPAQALKPVAGRDPATMLSSMLGYLPGVSLKKHFHHTSFVVGGKVFAFTRNDGVAMKLAKEKIEELVDRRVASHLVMGKRTMKEWMVIQHDDPSEYKKYLALFKESLAFVSKK